jgi:signal transduction histidine kinase
MKPVARAQASRPVDLLGALSIFAHDLRGPLANLALLLEVITSLAESGRTETIARRSRQAEGIVEALSDLLTSLLARVRATGDPLGAEDVPCDIGRLLKHVSALSGPLAESRRVTLRRIGRKSIYVPGDEQLLVQALDNLLGNAVKHSPPDTDVTCELAVDNGQAVILISDCGKGFAHEDLRRAFRPFTTLSARADDARTSFGLGLWIARLIAERHRGSLEAAARRDGPGATLIMRLPLARRATNPRFAAPINPGM